MNINWKKNIKILPNRIHESSLTNLMASSVSGLDLKWVCRLELFQLHSFSGHPFSPFVLASDLLKLHVWLHACGVRTFASRMLAPALFETLHLRLPVLCVGAQVGETGLWILHSYRSGWWLALRWGERSLTLLAGGSPRHACAAAHRSGGCITTRQSWLMSHAGTTCEEGLPAWAGCSRPGGTVWWRSAGTRLTSFGDGAWRIGRPRRKNGPFDSCRSQRPSSAGLCCTCRKHTGGLMVMLKYEEVGGGDSSIHLE